MVTQWIKNRYTCAKNHVRLGVSLNQARMVGMSRKGLWAMSNTKPFKAAISNGFLAKKGFIGLVNQHQTLGKVT